MSSQGQAPRRAAVFLFVAVTFLFWASLYTYVPVLPVYATSLGASLAMAGLVVSAYAVTQLLLRIPVGIWTDALGRRKPFAVAGLVFTCLGAVGMALAPAPWFLFAARAVTGAGAAMWVVLTITFVSYFPASRTVWAMSFINFTSNSAVLAATLSGGFIAQRWGLQAAFWAALTVGLPGLVLVFFVREPEVRAKERLSVRDVRRVALRPTLLTVSAIALGAQFISYSTHFSFVPVFARQLGASSAELGLLTTVAMAFKVLGILAVPSVVARLGSRHGMYLGVLLLAVPFAVVPATHTLWPLYVTQAVTGFGSGVSQTIPLALAIHNLPNRERATAMGVYQALYSIGMFLGPFVSGRLAQAMGIGSVFYLSAAVGLGFGLLSYVRAVPRR